MALHPTDSAKDLPDQAVAKPHADFQRYISEKPKAANGPVLADSAGLAVPKLQLTGDLGQTPSGTLLTQPRGDDSGVKSMLHPIGFSIDAPLIAPKESQYGETGGKRTYKDDSTFQQVMKRDGSIEYIGHGKSAGDEYRVRVNSDGTYKVLDASGKEVPRTSDEDVVRERTRLDELAKGFADPELRSRFRADMARLEGRFPTNSQEIAQTFSNIASMLERRGSSAVPPETVDRLAQDIMHETGVCDSHDQGAHNTCDVSSAAYVIMVDSPSVVAKAIRDLAGDGSFKLANGKVLTMDEHSLNPDSESAGLRKLDGARSLASQYLDVLMVNAGVSERKEQFVFRNHETDGEQLFQKQPDGSFKVVGNKQDLHEDEVVRAYRLLAGDRAKKDLILVQVDNVDLDENLQPKKIDGVLTFRNADELREILARKQKEGGFPMIIITKPSQPGFRPADADSTVAKSCTADPKSLSFHAIVIKSFEDGIALIHNQWGSRCNYGLPVDRLYNASIDRGSELYERVEEGRRKNVPDMEAEIEQYGNIAKFAKFASGDQRKFYEELISKAEERFNSGSGNLFTPAAYGALVDYGVRMDFADRQQFAEFLRRQKVFQNRPDIADVIGDTS